MQVPDLRDCCEQAAAKTGQLQFVGRRQEQLPFTWWNPDAYQLGPATTHKLVYLATHQQKQQCVVKFTQQ